MGDEKELDDLDPFGEKEEADKKNLITPPMVGKATFLIHKLADRRGADFKEIQKKCKKLLGYENLAKVTLENGHAIIDKLIELTGGEEEVQSPTPQHDGGGISAAEVATIQIEEKEREKKKKIDAQDEDVVTSTMREAIRAAVDITIKEVVDKEVPVQGLGGFVLEIGKVIFEAKMSEEADQCLPT
jgi:hypothetical protein